MGEFHKLLQILEREIEQQEKLLRVLTEERVAIVKLNQEQIDQLNVKKAELLTEARDIEGKRQKVVEALMGPMAKSQPTLKFRDLLVHCSSSELKMKLQSVGEELRKTVTIVQEMNEHNAKLVHQALGVISTTVAIISTGTTTELPTYGESGVLKEEGELRSPGVKGRISREV